MSRIIRMLSGVLLALVLVGQTAMAAPAIPADFQPFVPHFLDVTYGNGLFVAVGFDGAIFTSPDGASWTPRHVPTLAQFNSVVYGDGTFLAVASDGTVARSTDGIHWSLYDTDKESLRGLAYGAGRFVTARMNETLSSTDGIHWEGIVHEDLTLTNLNDEVVPSQIFVVAYGNGEFLLVDRVGHVLRSPDGLHWAKENMERFHFESNWLVGNNLMRGAAFGNGRWVVVGSTRDGQGQIWHGMSQDFRDQEFASRLWSVVFAEGRFFAVGDKGTILTSADGREWTVEESGTSMPLIGIAYGGGKLVAVGPGGTVLSRAPGDRKWTLHEVRWTFTPPEVMEVDFKVTLNGQPMDVPVVVADGRSLVPVRAIAELLGADVEWVQDLWTVVIAQGDKTILLPVGPRYARVNSDTLELDVPAVIVDGRTRVPLRFVAEALGVTVNWNQETRTIELISAQE